MIMDPASRLVILAGSRNKHAVPFPEGLRVAFEVEEGGAPGTADGLLVRRRTSPLALKGERLVSIIHADSAIELAGGPSEIVLNLRVWVEGEDPDEYEGQARYVSHVSLTIVDSNGASLYSKNQAVSTTADLYNMIMPVTNPIPSGEHTAKLSLTGRVDATQFAPDLHIESVFHAD